MERFYARSDAGSRWATSSSNPEPIGSNSGLDLEGGQRTGANYAGAL